MQAIILIQLHKVADRLRMVSQRKDIPTRDSIDVLIALNYVLDSISILSTADEQQDCTLQ